MGPGHHTLFECMEDDTIRFSAVQVPISELSKKTSYRLFVIVVYFIPTIVYTGKKNIYSD